MAPTLHPPCDGGLAPNVRFRPPAPEWQRFAACRGSDPALFHGTPATHRKAQLLCRRCPVAEICLWSAMVAEAPTPYRYGVWGATAPRQRHELAEALGRPAVGEYLRRLHAAVEAWHALAAWSATQSAQGAQEATDAA
ncbi:MAG: WhiB family transcriptional regulator [Actinomycetota bacterium]|nr:WhiB family transcriptional regulator [Actinomycetota bacterium]